MYKYLIISLMALLVAVGCQDNSNISTTKLGNKFIKYTNSTEGMQATEGTFAYVDVISRAGDSLMVDTRAEGAPPTAVQILPDTLGPDMISPVEDVLRGLYPGDSVTVIWRIDTIPNKPPGFENIDTLFYDLYITEVVSEGEFNARREQEMKEKQAEMDAVILREPEVLEFVAEIQKQYAEGTLEGVQTAEDGLKYLIHEEGSGPQAEKGSNVTVQYVGALADNGTVFDQSFRRGQGITFPLGVGRVIRGWDDGLALFKEGTKATLFIPAELGYGAGGTPDGSIPPNAELMFYVELEEVR